MNKWPVIVNEIYLNMPDIICICETRQMPDSRDCDSFHIDDYVTFADCSVGRCDGGTLVLGKAELQQTLAHHDHNCRHQCNIIDIYLGIAKLKTIVYCTYRPPDTTAAESDTFIKHLKALTASATSRIIIGDCKYPNIDWFKPSHSAHDEINDAFQNTCDDMGLTQCVTSATRGNHILDMVLLSHSEQLIDCSCRLHQIIYLFCLTSTSTKQNKSIQTINLLVLILISSIHVGLCQLARYVQQELSRR